VKEGKEGTKIKRWNIIANAPRRPTASLNPSGSKQPCAKKSRGRALTRKT